MHATAWSDEPTALSAPDAHTPSAAERPALRVLAESADQASADVDPPAGRAAFRGAVIGFLLVGTGMTLMGSAAGAGMGGSIGLGVFVGAWGGVGFGGMLGATMCVARADDERIAAEKNRRQRDTSGDHTAGTPDLASR